MVHCGNRMAFRQRGKLFAPCVEESVTGHRERISSMLEQGCEGIIDIALVACSQDMELQTERLGDSLVRLDIDSRVGRIDEKRQVGRLGDQLMQQLHALCSQRPRKY